MTHGVMVTHLVLVQAFKVRVLVSQQIKYTITRKPCKTSLLHGFFFKYTKKHYNIANYLYYFYIIYFSYK